MNGNRNSPTTTFELLCRNTSSVVNIHLDTSESRCNYFYILSFVYVFDKILEDYRIYETKDLRGRV